VRRAFRNLLYGAAKGLGMLPRLRGLGQGPLVYFYHGVEAGPVDPVLAGLHLPLDVFARQVDFLAANFQIISLDELRAGLRQSQGLGPGQALITFDDGFANHAEVAGPFLAARGLPFAVFVSTHALQTRERIPTYYPRALLAQPDLRELDLPSLGTRLSLKGEAARQAARLELTRVLKSADQATVRLLLADLRAALPEARWRELDARHRACEPLTWAQARELTAMGGTIGSHGHEHALLHAGQPAAEVSFQLARSRELIIANLGRCDYLAYPNGRLADACPPARAEAARLGYSLAFTTLAGEVRPGLDPLLLPRLVAPAETGSGLRELDLQVSRRLGINRAYARALAEGGDA
jgi:hypothetical protein